MKSLFFITIFVMTSATAMASCESLKEKFSSQARPSSQSFGEMNELIKNDDLCVKNLVGRLNYQGQHFEKNVERAHAIFYELSERNYPPAQFNLAYLLVNEGDTDPKVVIALLQGLYVSYIGTNDYGKLASNARDMGRQYLDDVTANCRSPERCSEKHGYSREEIGHVKNEFNNVVRLATYNKAAEIVQATQELRNTADAFVGILSLGMAAYSVGAARAANSAAYTANAAAARSNALSIANQMRPRIYSVYPMGGNTLYMVPLQ